MWIIPYGRASDHARRRIALAIMGLVGAAVVATVFLAGVAKRTARLLIVQYACMEFSPPEPLIFEERLEFPGAEGVRPLGPAGGNVRRLARSVAERRSPLFKRWQELCTLAHAPDDAEGTTLIFLHALRAKDDGKVYIVSVRYRLDVQNWIGGPVLTESGVQNRFSLSSEFTTDVVIPGGLTHSPRFCPTLTSPVYLLSESDRGGLLRFESGVVDSADPAAFAIHYRFNGHTGTVYGVLKSASSVELRVEAPSTVGSP